MICQKMSWIACLLLILAATSLAFSPSIPTTGGQTTDDATHPLSMSAVASEEISINGDSSDRVDVVVFGVGDLRTDDHGGLIEAMKASSDGGKSAVPVVVLDKNMLQNIPGATAYTYDTAAMIHHALSDLERSLHDKFGLTLKVLDTVDELVKLNTGNNEEQLHVHVCDLGPADNDMGYGPYSALEHVSEESDNVKLHAWNCRLRNEPWETLETLTDLHPEYAKEFLGKEPQIPSRIITHQSETQQKSFSSSIPSIEALVELLSSSTSSSSLEDAESQHNTGLYATHWGGLDPSTVGESQVLETVSKFVDEYKENDVIWNLEAPSATRNAYSLEHAAVKWFGNANLIAGERMTRYLAAPLFLGTMSPRRLWHASCKRPSKSILRGDSSVLQTLAESKEWHSLLAARNLLKQSQDKNLEYKYWRWHGFLCRYAEYNNDSPSLKDEGLLLIHGFGASGSQWKGTMEALAALDLDQNILAPDLIGFGHSEKPPLSYTQYLWESYCSAFAKEVGKDWKTYVVGGNSIGGYTSMGMAADDAAVAGKDVSASGATGSGKCTGVVLMNSAGQIKAREDLVATSELKYTTIAQITSTDLLPACKPLPRAAARIFGNALLWYLRPRIQSICKNLYPTNPDAVNDELCSGILRDSLDPGAINVMISGSKLPPPRTANELLGADYGSAASSSGEGTYKGPVLVAQGMLDPLNDAKLRAAMLGDLRKDITVSPIDAGHCPHDEVPSEVAEAMHKWMRLQATTPKVTSDGNTLSTSKV